MMKRTTPFFALLIAAILLAACSTSTPDRRKGMVIQGTMDNAAGENIYFQLYDNTGDIDTAVVGQDGSFRFELPLKKLDFYKVYLNRQSQLVLILDSTDTDIQVSADATNIPGTMQITGSEDSELMVDFFRRQNEFTTRMDSVNGLLRSMGPEMQEMRQALASQVGQQQADFQKEMADLASKHSSSPAALGLVAMFNPMDHLPVVEKVYTDLEKRMPGSKYVDGLKGTIAKAKAQKTGPSVGGGVVPVGEMAPEIALPTPNGEVITLSSLRGKYVLIDFWASWCGPCRRENPNVKRMYDKYKKENFEILGVSFDKDKARWEQAIAADGLPWLHVSDLKKWQSAAAGPYGVRSIPHTVLVNPEGKVVATKLRGAALDNKMAELFGY